MLNINSPLCHEALNLQQNLTNHLNNEMLREIHKKSKNLFYREQTFNTYLKRQMQIVKGKYLDLMMAKDSESFYQDIVANAANNKNYMLQSFYIDLDCQFLMVPKKIIQTLLVKRLIYVMKRIVTYSTPIQKSVQLEELKDQDQFNHYENCSISKKRVQQFNQMQSQLNAIAHDAWRGMFAHFDKINNLINDVESKKQIINIKEWSTVNKHVFKNLSMITKANQNQMQQVV